MFLPLWALLRLVLHEDVTWKCLRTVLLLESERNFSVKNIFQVTSSSSPVSSSAGSSQVSHGGLEGQGQCGAPGSQSLCGVQPLQQRTGTFLEALDVICGCWYVSG